jgi:hypothetical protein
MYLNSMVYGLRVSLSEVTRVPEVLIVPGLPGLPGLHQVSKSSEIQRIVFCSHFRGRLDT